MIEICRFTYGWKWSFIYDMAMIFMASGNFQNILKANLKSKNLFKLFPKNSEPLQFLSCSGSQKVPFGSIPYKAVLLY